MARVKTGAITKEEADAKLLDARGKMFGSDARKADGAAATDARAMRERYAEYEKGLMARVQKGAKTKKEADANLKEAREKMFGGAERAKGKSQADEKATAARYEALETRIKAAVESGRLTEEEGKARLRQAKERMAEGAKKGPASEGAKGDQPVGDKPKRDQDALRARYAEYEKRLKAAVDKGEMTADEAATKLKEARQRMSGDRR